MMGMENRRIKFKLDPKTIMAIFRGKRLVFNFRHSFEKKVVNYQIEIIPANPGIFLRQEEIQDLQRRAFGLGHYEYGQRLVELRQEKGDINISDAIEFLDKEDEFEKWKAKQLEDKFILPPEPDDPETW